MESVSVFREEKIAAEAVEWIGRLEDPSADAREAFADWITRSPDHVREFLSATAVLEELSQLRGYPALGGIVADAGMSYGVSDRKTELMMRAVGSLSDPCRRALTLRKVYGWSQRQIADRLGMPDAVVERHLSEASWRLARMLDA